MERLQLAVSNLQETAVRAAEVLRSGGVVLYPTDTLYGLGADALSDEAVAKVFRIKGRNEGKPVHAIVSDIEMAAQYGEVSDIVRRMVEALPRGKVTYIVKKKEGIESGIAKGIDTFGFRIPDNDFCIAMIEAFDGPVTATSANRAGEAPQRSVEAILHQLGENADMIDLVVDGGELPQREPSTVIDISGAVPRIVRTGEVSEAQILPLLG
jgi:L-threonylcarbamoyladenylate synthase